MVFNFNTPKTPTGFTLPTSTAPISTAGGASDAKPQAKTTPGLFGSAGSFPFNPATTKVGTPTASVSATMITTNKPSFGITPTTSTTTASQLNFGAPGSTTTSASSTFTPIGTGLSFGSATTTTASSVAPALKLTPSLPASTTTATTTATPSVPVSLGLPTTTTSALVTPSTSTTTTTAATASSALPSTSTALTYAQLEDSINKWTLDLEEQGKFFINQAKQLNAWDSLLVSNGDKILNLNEMIEKVKEEQKQLDQELDFVLAQQNELDELSLPLEKQLSEIPITDQSRFQMYQMSEIIDSQMKQMSEDLKEIIDHLNESNKNEDVSDPITQISRILNAHMNSLQWIDRNTSEISSHLDQVTKMHEVYRKNHLNL